MQNTTWLGSFQYENRFQECYIRRWMSSDLKRSRWLFKGMGSRQNRSPYSAVMFLAAIHNLNFISPFKVEGGMKMNSANYQQLLSILAILLLASNYYKIKSNFLCSTMLHPTPLTQQGNFLFIIALQERIIWLGLQRFRKLLWRFLREIFMAGHFIYFLNKPIQNLRNSVDNCQTF